MTPCQHCSRLYDEANLCFECQRALHDKLVTAAVFAHQLQVTITRQSKMGGPREGGKSTETPLPFDSNASEAEWIMRQTLIVWADEIDASAFVISSATAVVARWLAEHVRRLARLGSAGQCFDEVDQSITVAVRAVDCKPVRLYLGHCQCGTELFGDPDVPEYSCVRCGVDHDTNTRRIANQQQARDVVVTANEAAVYLGSVFGIRLRVSRIQNWGTRGKVPRVEVAGLYLYRLGDVLDAARETASGVRTLGDSEP